MAKPRKEKISHQYRDALIKPMPRSHRIRANAYNYLKQIDELGSLGKRTDRAYRRKSVRSFLHDASSILTGLRV